MNRQPFDVSIDIPHLQAGMYLIEVATERISFRNLSNNNQISFFNNRPPLQRGGLFLFTNLLGYTPGFQFYVRSQMF